MNITEPAILGHTNVALQILQHQTPLNETFVAGPMMLLLLIQSYANGNKTQEELIAKKMTPPDMMFLYRQHLFFQLDSVHTSQDIPLRQQIARNKWIFDRELNETIKNPESRDEDVRLFNEQISNKTNGRIAEVLKPDELKDGGVAEISLNYFKRQWKTPFDAAKTFTAPFYSSEGTKRNVEFLSTSRQFAKYSENEQFQMLSIAYETSPEITDSLSKLRHAHYLLMLGLSDVRLSMNIFLPKTRFGLNEAIKTLNASTFQDLMASAKDSYVKAAIQKFQIDKPFDCEAFYNSIGLGDIIPSFETKDEETERAEWDEYYRSAEREQGPWGEDGPQRKPIPQIHHIFRHVASIGMDENGSNTDDIIPESSPESPCFCGVRPQSSKFIADHPFMFAVMLNDNPILVGTHF